MTTPETRPAVNGNGRPHRWVCASPTNHLADAQTAIAQGWVTAEQRVGLVPR